MKLLTSNVEGDSSDDSWVYIDGYIELSVHHETYDTYMLTHPRKEGWSYSDYYGEIAGDSLTANIPYVFNLIKLVSQDPVSYVPFHINKYIIDSFYIDDYTNGYEKIIITNYELINNNTQIKFIIDKDLLAIDHDDDTLDFCIKLDLREIDK